MVLTKWGAVFNTPSSSSPSTHQQHGDAQQRHGFEQDTVVGSNEQEQ